MEQVGDGAHGTVWRDRANNIAVKKTRMMVSGDGDLYMADGCVNELVSLIRARECGVKHVVDVIGHDIVGDMLTLTMEWLEPIRKLISANVDCRRYIRQLFVALDGLHDADIAHRDVKLDNLLYRRSSDSIVLIDFGLAKVDGCVKPPEQLAYTVEYRPPEILLDFNGYDPFKADIWAAGVCAYSFMTARSTSVFLKHDGDWRRMLEAILKFLGYSGLPGNSEWPHISKNHRALKYASKTMQGSANIKPVREALTDDTAISFLTGGVMTLSPKSRMTAREALAHPYLKLNETNTAVSPNQQQQVSEHESRQLDTATVDACENTRIKCKLCYETLFKAIDIIENMPDCCCPAAAIAVATSLCEPKLVNIWSICHALETGIFTVKRDISRILTSRRTLSALATPSALRVAHGIVPTSDIDILAKKVIECYRVKGRRPSSVELWKCCCDN